MTIVVQNILQNSLNITFRILPSIVSLILCRNRFNHKTVARGIDIYPNTCNDLENVRTKEYPCLYSGLTAIAVVRCWISAGLSMIIISHFSSDPSVAYWSLAGGAFVIVWSFFSLHDLDLKAFKSFDERPVSTQCYFQRVRSNHALWNNLIATIFLIIFYILL